MSIFYELWDSLIAKVIAAIVSPIILALLYYGFRRVHRAFQALRLVEAALRAVARIEKDGLWAEGPGFWLKLPIQRPVKHSNSHDRDIKRRRRENYSLRKFGGPFRNAVDSTAPGSGSGQTAPRARNRSPYPQ